MNWHAPTEEEIAGLGDHVYLVDISPDTIPHQAMTDGDALFRVMKPGWSWIVKDLRRPNPWLDSGECDTKEAAIGDAQAALARLRVGAELERVMEEENGEKRKRSGWFRRSQ